MFKYFDVFVRRLVRFKNFDVKYHKSVCYDGDSEVLV